MQAVINNWDGAVIGIMIDKISGVESMREHGINCHQLLGVESQDAKAEAINGLGLIAMRLPCAFRTSSVLAKALLP